MAMETHLKKSYEQHRPDPRQRFIFLSAPHSRATLKVTRKMLMQVLTYHQVMPAFMQFVFPFGKQHYLRDFHLMGFRSQSCRVDRNHDQQIAELGRSGRHLEFCYSMKSVERSGDVQNPWAIRQCSTFHRLDLESGQTVWILLKANKVLEDAIHQDCDHHKCSDYDFGTAVSTALRVHRLLADWACENWHWYINDLESSVQEKTRRALYIPVEDTIAGSVEPSPENDTARAQPLSQRTRSWTLTSISQTIRRQTTLLSLTTPAVRAPPVLPLTEMPKRNENVDQRSAVDDFSYKDLQGVQTAEDKANESLHILRANSRVLKELGREYMALSVTESLKDKIKECQADLVAFDEHLQSAQKDMEMQQARIETLLRVLADRKSLLQGRLQYRNMEATRLLAEQAQDSAKNMELMTRQMHLIAKRTQVDTVSMKVITVVTLFFLPGTFISTLMSTPIVKFDSSNGPSATFSWRNIGVGALELYLIVSLPLVILTCVVGYLYYRREKRREHEVQNDAEKLVEV